MRRLSSIVHFPQSFVDNIGMYRVVTGSLAFLAAISIVAGFFGFMAYSGESQLTSLTTALSIALALNIAIAWTSKIPANHESAIITALILFFLVIPGETFLDNWPLMIATAVAILSKFILSYRKQHFANPAAIGALALSLPGFYVFSWWVGNPVLFLPILILGCLVVMKVRKWTPVLWFIGIGLVTYLVEAIRFDQPLFEATELFFFSWPTLFLAFFMLTEPFTMPPTKGSQAMYGALVGFLSNTAILTPLISMSPELALVIGNIAIAPLRVTQKLYLALEEKKLIAKDTYEFTFKKPTGFTFKPGQYLEWMLPHTASDNRGVRRYFTIASSPTEPEVRVALKIPKVRSSYKDALTKLDITDNLIASQLAGDFILPRSDKTKLAFVAGGIGITPFRSHLKYMHDSNQSFDTVLYYCNNTVDEIAYGALFEDIAKDISLELVHVIAKETVPAPYEQGFVTQDMIKRRTPDYAERIWYISGPPGMVNAYYALLKSMGIKRNNIKTDFFPGVV